MSESLRLETFEYEERIFCDFCREDKDKDLMVHLFYDGKNLVYDIFCFCVNHLQDFLEIIKNIASDFTIGRSLYGGSIKYGYLNEDHAIECDYCNNDIHIEDKFLCLEGIAACIFLHQFCVEDVLNGIAEDIDKEKIITELI